MATTVGGWVRHLVTFAVASTFACVTLTGFATSATATGDPAIADAVPQSGSQVGELTAQSGDQESAVTPQADLSTGKLTVDCAEESPVCTVAWEVTVRASNLDEEGREGLTGGQMTFSLSSAVYDVEVSLANQVIPQIGKRANGDFTTRQYGLPDMNTDEEIIVSLAGKIDRPDANQGEEQGGGAVAGPINDSDLTAGGTLPSEILSGVDTKIQSDDEEPIYTEAAVIGAQVWITFDQAPREEPSLPAPAIPNAGASDLPSYDVQNPWGAGPWVGNSTCPAREDASAEVVGGYESFEGEGQANGATKQGSPKNASVAETGSGSQCDQAWVQVEPMALPSEEDASPSQGGAAKAPMEALLRDGGDDGFDVVKGTPVEDPITGGYSLETSVQVQEDPDNPGFTKPIPVELIGRNVSAGPLNNLGITDENTAGIEVQWDKCVVTLPSGATTTADISDAEWGIGNAGSWVYDAKLPSELMLVVGETITCSGTVPAMPIDAAPTTGIAGDSVLHENWGLLGGCPTSKNCRVETAATITGSDTFRVLPIPEPKFTVEKGIMEAVGPYSPSLCAPGQFQTGNPNICNISTGAAASPVELEYLKDTTVTFRIKNTADEILTVDSLVDQTMQGFSSIAAISCYTPLPGGGAPVAFPADLTVNGTFVCTGTLKMSPGETHQNTVTVTATGKVSGTQASVSDNFYAKSPVVLPALPVTGGLGTHIFVLTTGTLVAVALVLYAIKIKRGRVRPDGE